MQTCLKRAHRCSQSQDQQLTFQCVNACNYISVCNVCVCLSRLLSPHFMSRDLFAERDIFAWHGVIEVEVGMTKGRASFFIGTDQSLTCTPLASYGEGRGEAKWEKQMTECVAGEITLVAKRERCEARKMKRWERCRIDVSKESSHSDQQVCLMAN